MVSNLEKLKDYEIIYAWTYLEWGGMQTYFFASLRLLVREGLRVKVVMPRGSSAKLIAYLEEIGVGYEFFKTATKATAAPNLLRKLQRRWRKMRAEISLVRHLAKKGFARTIIQIDAGPWQDFLLLYYLARKTHTFTTPHIALPFNEKSRRCQNWCWNFHRLAKLPKFHLNVANCDVLENFRNYLPPEAWKKIALCYSGINTAEIKLALATEVNREKLCAEFGLPSDRKLVFSLGQVIERKGWRILLNAIEKLKNDFPQLFFVWIGEGEQLQEFERLIIERNLQNFVRLIKPTQIGESRQDLLTLLRLAHLFIMPSLKEGLPQALLEALGLGLPCIASNINGIPEVIRHEQTGLLTEPGSPEDLADKIRQIVTDEKMRLKIAENGQQLAFNEFDEKIGAGVMLESYAKAVIAE